MDKRIDHSCNRKAECFHRSFVIVHTERGWWYASPYSKNWQPHRSQCKGDARYGSDTVFKEFLEVNVHARTVDTRRSSFPSPFSAPGNEARNWEDSTHFCHLCHFGTCPQLLLHIFCAQHDGEPSVWDLQKNSTINFYDLLKAAK